MKSLAMFALVLLAAPCLAAGNGNYATVNGLSMYYETHGPATSDRPTLVLLHGGSSTIDALQPESLAFIESATGETWPPPVKAAYMRIAPDPQHWGAFIAKVKHLWLETPDWPEAQLKSIHAPVLLLFGDHDDIRLEHATLMRSLIPKSQLAVLPGTSHFTVIEQADLVAKMTITFLDAGS